VGVKFWAPFAPEELSQATLGVGVLVSTRKGIDIVGKRKLLSEKLSSSWYWIANFTSMKSEAIEVTAQRGIP
jgi:hypothetical protein